MAFNGISTERMKKWKAIPLHNRILIGMIVGILAGVLVKQAGLEKETADRIVAWVEPLGQIFLRMIFMTVIPLIFAALVLGVAEMGDLKKVGRIGKRLLVYSFIVSSISVFIGIAMVNAFKPGANLKQETRDYLVTEFIRDSKGAEQKAELAKERGIGDIITEIVPKNPLEDMTRAFEPGYRGGGLLAVMFFALIFGIALASSEPEKTATLKSFFEGLYEVVLKIIGYAMQLAPVGVAALLFNLVVNVGASFLLVLLQYVLIVLAALAIQQFITYSIILRFFAGRNPLTFFRKTSEVMITAFSTSSSNATLPTAIAVSIEKLKIPKPIANFVLTIGSTANQNGTALFEGITVLFLAQCFHIELSLASQITVVFLCILAGIGTAGVPGGSLPVIVTILVSIGVPGEAIGLIYGVDRILDMSRTVLNVTGDITAAAYIQKVEDKSELKKLRLEP
jgi:DAACS family dicarboxylate/amino acid:cation (Na+ or H+) symporter